MTALLEMPLASETLAPEELAAITGYDRKADQVAWLEAHGWPYVRTRGGEPIVGRLYVRLRLAGIDPRQLHQPAKAAPTWEPDFSRL